MDDDDTKLNNFSFNESIEEEIEIFSIYEEISDDGDLYLDDDDDEACLYEDDIDFDE
ncbi:MAG: hypothetical protein LUB56_01675 [Coprobacillus sp.]|nr:hypothetical protein [Coprobacillus sp.]